MRLRQTINEVTTKELPIGEAIELIKKKCKSAWGAFDVGKYLFRGGSGSTTGAKYYSGRTGRVSANTLNYYTLLMDNDPRWKRFPKRSESFICSTDQFYAENFGDSMYMFPVDGAVYGVCPYDDLWGSFDNTMPEYWRGQLGDMIYTISSLAEAVGVMNTRPKTYKALVKLFKDIDEGWALQDQRDQQDLVRDNTYMRKYNGDFMETFKDIIDPKKNGFKISKDIKKLPRSNEIWFSGPVYQISVEKLDEYLDFNSPDMMS